MIVAHGGEILDVIVEHPLYGELTGMLHIKTAEDIRSFMKRYRKSQASLLSELTDGIHLHTIVTNIRKYCNKSNKAWQKQASCLKGINNLLYEIEIGVFLFYLNIIFSLFIK